MLMVPPPCFPNSASYSPVCTLNSSIASGEGTGTPVLSGASSKPCDMALSALSPFRTTLLSQGRAPLAEIFTLLRPVAPASMTFAVTPGDKARIWVKLRLDSGTAFIIVLSTTCPRSDVLVCNCSASAVTSTDSVEEPTSKFTSITRTAVISTDIFCCS